MAYVKNTWVDQEGQVRYRETQDGDFKILTPNYEQVTEIGTPVNADNMNHIEDGIVENDAAITIINSKIPSNATSLNKMVTQLDLDGKADVDLSNTNPSESFINSVKSWISFAPDYSTKTTVASPYTATKDCFIANNGSQGRNGSTSMSINNVEVWHTGGGLDASQATTWVSPPFFVKSGDVVSGNTLYKYEILGE